MANATFIAFGSVWRTSQSYRPIERFEHAFIRKFCFISQQRYTVSLPGIACR